MSQYIARCIFEQLQQIITAGTDFIDIPSYHQRGGNIPGDDEFITQNLLYRTHFGFVEVALLKGGRVMKSTTIHMIAMAFVLATLSTSALAATHYIKADGTGDYATIQAGVNAAVAGDTEVRGEGIEGVK